MKPGSLESQLAVQTSAVTVLAKALDDAYKLMATQSTEINRLHEPLYTQAEWDAQKAEIERLQKVVEMTHAWIQQTPYHKLPPGWGHVNDAINDALREEKNSAERS